MYGPGFMAPEVRAEDEYSYPADVYGWAKTMDAMLEHNWDAPTRLRKTDENPARISVVDVAVAISGHDAHYAAMAVRRIREHDEEVHAKIVDLKFSGRGQQKTGKKQSMI